VKAGRGPGPGCWKLPQGEPSMDETGKQLIFSVKSLKYILEFSAGMHSLARVFLHILHTTRLEFATLLISEPYLFWRRWIS
jgi:hypothetical protein